MHATGGAIDPARAEKWIAGNSGRPETLAGFMICLDTNYLIKGMEPGSAEAARMTAWYQAGEPLITAMPAWFEFVCGPLTEQQEATIGAYLTEIVPLDKKQVREAARLFNKAAGFRLANQIPPPCYALRF